MLIRFWGVRGTIACPGSDTLRYGGNTACIELRCDGRLLILDGGTGLRPLAQALGDPGEGIDADLFFSHCHLDHIIGAPLFAPFHDAKNRFRLWAGNLAPAASLKQVVCALMAPPLFPVPPDIFKAAVEYRDFRAGDTLEPHPGITIRTRPLNHPDGATGYRIEHGGKAVAYITDTEHRDGGLDANVLELVHGAGLMIYDSTFTDEEYAAHRGWGHSTWQEAVRLADAGRVGTLALFHHDPAHDDDFMDKIAAAAIARRPGTIVAREGMTITL
jgi:phosphoribosyl 1,2-cyclic phosphodiesterase